jgi:hypothetical protein
MSTLRSPSPTASAANAATWSRTRPPAIPCASATAR